MHGGPHPAWRFVPYGTSFFFSLLLPFLIADDMTENIGLIILVSEARA